MSYWLECQICTHRVEVHDPAAPTATQCPTCTSFYSFLPVRERRRVVLSSIAAIVGDDVPATRVAPPPEVPAAERTACPTGTTEVAHAPLNVPSALAAAGPRLAVLVDKRGAAVHRVDREPKPPAATARRAPAARLPEYEPPRSPFLLTASGPAAALLGTAALAAAWVPSLNGWAAPLGAAGALAGLAGAAVDDGTNRSRLLPAGAAGLCSLVLLAVLVPAIGAAVGLGRASWGVHPNAVRVVPLSGDALGPDAEATGWVDASRAAVQQGKVGIQVLSATLGPAGHRQALVVRLRVQRLWTDDMPATDKDADPLPAAVPQAALTDDEGHPCRLLPA
jgi:hypothetical protein